MAGLTIAGATALSGGLAALGGLTTAGINAGASAGATRRARKENYHYNELAAQNADQRTRALYGDLYSPGAQLQQLKDAGLSPSLMYQDGGGISGQAGAQGAGTAGPVQNPFYLDPLTMAQTANLMADTKKKEAEAENTGANTQLQKTQTASIELQNYVLDHTKDAKISEICSKAEEAEFEARKAVEEWKNAGLLTEFNEKTLETRVETAKKQLQQISQSILESQSQVHLNDQRKEYLRNEVLKSFEDMMIKWKEIDLEEKRTETYSEWIDAQIPNIEKQLEIKLKELGIEKTRLITNTVIESMKMLAQGAMAYSMYSGGKGSDATPPQAKDILKKGASGGNAVPPKYQRPFVYDNVWSE